METRPLAVLAALNVIFLSAAGPVVAAGPLVRSAAPLAPPSPPPPAPESPAEHAAKLRERGNDAMLAMRYGDALDAYLQATALAPDDVEIRYSVARAHQFLGNYPDALDALEAFDRGASPEARAKIGNIQDLFAQIRPRVSTLVLRSPTAGARVILRDKIVGTTPLLPIRVSAGAATLQVELNGFFTETREVVAPGGGNLELSVDLHPKMTSGLLSVVTEPLGASVAVDGRAIGTSNPRLEVALPAGPHDVIVTRDGFEVARVPLVLAPGTTREITVTMQQRAPITTKWWFWSGVGAAVVGGVALGIALSTEHGPSNGTLAPGRVSAP